METKEAHSILQRVRPSIGLMKISEAAQLAGLHPETIRRRVRRGELAAWGNPRRVDLNDLLKLFVPPSVCEK